MSNLSIYGDMSHMSIHGQVTHVSHTGDRACQNNRALVCFPSRQEIDKSLKSRKLQIFSIFATSRLLYRVIDMPISIFRFSCLISECHLLGNEDIFTLVMMMKKLRWFQLRNILRIAVTKSNEQLKTIKIVQDWSFSEIQWEVRDPLLSDICSVSMMSQAFLDRHFSKKLFQSLDSLVCRDSWETKKKDCISNVLYINVDIWLPNQSLVNVCLPVCYYFKNCFVLVQFPFVCYWYL